MNFVRLFKKSSTGKILSWEISVEGTTIVTRHGQLNGAIVEARDTVTEGKNVGKKNATTPESQAVAEATARHEKQRKTKGYVDSLEAAEAGERDALVEGGIDPMLAHKWRDHSRKIQYPAYVQPKLDGIRCIAVVEGGECTLWTRTRKPITGVPHIAAAILQLGIVGDFTLDGELYNHSYKADFEKIVSYVRQVVPKEGHEVVQYHVYDCLPSLDGLERFASRRDWLTCRIPSISYDGPLKVVETVPVTNEDDVLESFSEYLAQGYEGCMVRNKDSKYVNKRSYDLLKVKEMADSEFEVVGVEEGRGIMTGKAIFVCKTDTGETFKAKMKGSLDSLGQYVVQPDLAIGKMLTVQYQNLTAYGLPRFPVGVRLRATLGGGVL